jgi:CRISPR-associated protein Csm3
MQKVGHYVILGTIELVSGARIGGSDDVLQIGGTDLTCIKDPVTGRPYLPGSSLKGKLRSSLERDLGRYSNNGEEPCGCASVNCPICVVFGPHKKTEHSLGPTRMIVRDAPVIGNFKFENKTESIINRKTGTAQHPRTVERVAPGAKFQLQIEVQEFDQDQSFTYRDTEGNELRGADALLEVVDHALWLAEQTGFGAGTGRGYGRVKVHWDGNVQEVKRKSRPRKIVMGNGAEAGR